MPDSGRKTEPDSDATEAKGFGARPAGLMAVATVIAAVTGLLALFVTRGDGDPSAAPPQASTQTAWAVAATEICHDQRLKVEDLEAKLHEQLNDLQPDPPTSVMPFEKQRLDVWDKTLTFLSNISEKGAEQAKAREMMDAWREITDIRRKALSRAVSRAELEPLHDGLVQTQRRLLQGRRLAEELQVGECAAVFS